MTYCVVQINFLPLPRFLKEVTMKTAEERYEELGTVILSFSTRIRGPQVFCTTFAQENVLSELLLKWI